MSDRHADVEDQCIWCGAHCPRTDDRVQLGLIGGRPGGPPAEAVMACVVGVGQDRGTEEQRPAPGRAGLVRASAGRHQPSS